MGKLVWGTFLAFGKHTLSHPQRNMALMVNSPLTKSAFKEQILNFLIFSPF